MATKFGIAFPVVITEEQRAYPIRIQLSPAPNNVHGLNVMFKGRKKTAQEKAGELIQYPLTPDYPFTEEKGRVSEIVRIFSSFSQRLQEEDKAMTLTFISDEPGHPEVKQENNGLYKMAFSPKSAGVALNLMQAIKSCDAVADETILISSQIRNNEPAALENPESIKVKARLCLENRHTTLFLHQKDWEDLRDVEEFRDVAGKLGDVSSSQEFENAMKNRRIFPLYVENMMLKDGDEWIPWRKALCNLFHLDFEPKAELVFDAAPIKESFDLDELHEPEEGSPLSLFLRAVKEDEWLPNELRAAAMEAIKATPSAAVALKALPPESLANPELDWNKEELFWLSQANRKKLMPNIIICGPTGSGKTLLAQALLLNALTEKGKALYIGPTRALVEEVYEKVSKLLPDHYHVVLSTGEECQDDWRFKNCEFDIACVVNEKANVILPMNPAMMEKLVVVVVDEIHMLSSEQRGGPLDMLLVKLKQKQELEGSDCRLRIAALTTEFSSEEKDLFCDYLTRFSDDEEARPPIVVSPPARPQSVLHSLILYNCGNEGMKKLILSEFSSQDDRQLGNEKALALKKNIEEAARSLYYPQSPHRVSWSTFSHRRADLLIQFAQKARRCLAVINSKEQIEELAALISTKREKHLQTKRENHPQTDGLNAETANKIQEICSLSCLADGLAEELVKQAKNGVYRHHADIPQNLRQVVEELFRRDDKPDGENTPILLCTETLSYGVNLRADMVVLLSLEFPRQDGSKKDFLTATEYHNILGRVGRFKNEDGPTPEAIVMLSQDYNYSTETPDKLAGYYKEIDCLKSAAIHNLDLRKFHQERLYDLDCVSFPSFRTVMDALRTAQSEREKGSSSYVKAEAVCRVLKDTFYYRQKKDKLKELDRFVGWMLDCASEMTASMSLSDDLSLVKCVRENGATSYHLESQGAALIDTGTSWKNLKHMHRWIERLGRLESRKLPAELFLPAFIADYDVFDEMIRPLKKNYAKGRERPDEWFDDLKNNLRDRLSNLLTDDMKNLIEPYIDQLLGTAEDCGYIEDCLKDRKIWEDFPDRQKKHLFLCVMLITLYWLDGEHEKMLDLTKNPLVPKSRQQNISERRFDRMSWSVQMCRSFFKEIRPVKGHIAEFSNLVLRLRKGVPEKGLPFAYGGQLTAQQIHHLLENNITPFKVLNGEDYPENIDKKGLLLPDWKKLGQQVKNFYGKECDRLQKELASTSDDSLKKIFHENCLKNHISKPDVEKFVEVCKLKDYFHFSDNDVFWLDFPQCEKKDGIFRIHLLSCEPNSNDTTDMNVDAACDLRFRKPKGEEAVFTPCALYTIGMKMDGGGVEWKNFFDSIAPGSIVTVSSILEYTGYAGDLAAIMEVPLE